MGNTYTRFQKCADCGEVAIRDIKHDAYFCGPCDRWIESRCLDPECEFCPTRPDKPSQVVYD